MSQALHIGPPGKTREQLDREFLILKKLVKKDMEVLRRHPLREVYEPFKLSDLFRKVVRVRH
jgi:hypothetical protein